MFNRSLEGGQPKKTMGNQKIKTGCPKGKLVKKQVSNTVTVSVCRFSVNIHSNFGAASTCNVV